MRIGITKADVNHSNYSKWIWAYDESIEIVDLSFEKNNISAISTCDGIILSGGVDMHPSFFLKNYIENYTHAPSEFKKNRDQFELEVLDISFKSKIPILGICRGLQLVNVYFEGTLHLDIGEKNEFHKQANGLDKKHAVDVDVNSQFYKIVKQEIGETNSAHHQAIDILGPGLKAVAISEDNLIEAIELVNVENQFLIAVQWHPERMEDQESAFSKNIRDVFLDRSKKHFE